MLSGGRNLACLGIIILYLKNYLIANTVLVAEPSPKTTVSSSKISPPTLAHRGVEMTNNGEQLLLRYCPKLKLRLRKGRSGPTIIVGPLAISFV